MTCFLSLYSGKFSTFATKNIYQLPIFILPTTSLISIFVLKIVETLYMLVFFGIIYFIIDANSASVDKSTMIVSPSLSLNMVSLYRIGSRKTFHKYSPSI